MSENVPPSRQDPDYWRTRPADHNVAGLYREGPQEASNPLARLIPPSVYTDPVPPPKVAGQITQYVRRRARALLRRRAEQQIKLFRALAGHRVRNQRTDAPAQVSPRDTHAPAAQAAAARVA